MKTTVIHGIEVQIADTFFTRFFGLIGRKAPPAGCGLLITKCNSIHTFFMSYPIDAIFLDANDKIVKEVKNIRPWRIFVWGGLNAKKVIEVASLDVK
jgi:uncharacterized membrane protein (UPF0127 family)